MPLPAPGGPKRIALTPVLFSDIFTYPTNNISSKYTNAVNSKLTITNKYFWRQFFSYEIFFKTFRLLIQINFLMDFETTEIM